MNLHYSQTENSVCVHVVLFYYLMNLHYSQTIKKSPPLNLLFYYLMNLHYSQTPLQRYQHKRQFYYLMNLHYSQTVSDISKKPDFVLLPYEFTLLSNRLVIVIFLFGGFTTL